MQDKKSLKNLIKRIKYKNWDIVLRFDEDRPYLQVQFDAPCSVTGVVDRQYCREWMLNYHMCDSEVVATAYVAVQRAELHEVAEAFKFMDEPVFRPHFDVYELHALSAKNAVDKRALA